MKKILLFLMTLTLITFFSCDPKPTAFDYNDWDIDDSGALDEAEYAKFSETAEYFNQWDINSDDYVGSDEWETHVGDYYDNYDYKEEGYFEDWDLDSDGKINQEEFNKVSYSLWDNNNDGLVDEGEFREYSFDI